MYLRKVPETFSPAAPFQAAPPARVDIRSCRRAHHRTNRSQGITVMASIKPLLRLLPCLLLVACGNPAPDGQLAVPSGATAPGKAATAAVAGKADNPVAAPAVATTTAAAKPGLPVDSSQLRPVTAIPGVACTQQRKDWAPECVAGEYRIAVYPDGCGADGFYGLVHADGDAAVLLQTSFAPFPASPVAKLREGQFVCIAADARKQVGERLWLYVTAIPPESIPACKDREICGARGLPAVDWSGTAPTGQCRLEHGRFVDCAAGWVSVSAVEEFSNGL